MAKLVLPSNYLLLVIFQCLVVFCLETHAIHYDSSFETKCLDKPLAPHYDGGLIVANDQVNVQDGFMGGRPKVSFHSIAGMLYVISGWFQIDRLGETNIVAVLKTDTEDIIVGRAMARSGCWSMFKGGLTAKTSGPAELYFTANDTEVDDDLVWADSLSVQPFTEQEWKIHQSDSMQKVRKNNVRVQVVDESGRPVPNASVSLIQIRGDFPFGCAINANILHNDGYKQWFEPRFKGRVTVFENELKWYSTEYFPGRVDYTTSDALVKYAQSLDMKIRGHNIFWDVELNNQPQWVLGLTKEQLQVAANNRIHSVMKQYAGKLFHWDVMNENLHGNFFEDKLQDPAASSKFYQLAQTLDPSAVMFMNEFNTIEWPHVYESSPQSYIAKMRQMKDQGFNSVIGMGLESHFPPRPDLVSIRTTLDQIAYQVSGPIWITELDVGNGGEGMEGVLNELASHHAVDGIILWSAMQKNGKCYVTCLTDDKFQNLPAGDIVDNFLKGLTHYQDPQLRGRRTDANGFVELSLHHGDYRLKITHSSFGHRRRHSIRKRINVRSNHTDSHVHRLTIPRMQ